MHWLYYAYSALVFAGGMTIGALVLRRARRAPGGDQATDGNSPDSPYPVVLPPLQPLGPLSVAESASVGAHAGSVVSGDVA
jgi:hypothetical protein